MAYNSPLASPTNYGVVEIGTGINVTNGVISVTGNGTVNTHLVNNAASPYTLDSGGATPNYYLGVVGTGAAISIILTVGTEGRVIVIKSEAGQTSDITITANVLDTIENAATYPILAASEGSVTLIYSGTNWNVV
jgi:uncharacterized protein (DUF39 family)